MNITEIKQFINDRIDQNDTDFPNARKTRALNVAQDQIVNAILEQDYFYQYDDPNYSDLNEGTLDLVSGTYIYDLRQDENFANILYIAKIFVRAKNDGEFYELEKDKITFETQNGVVVSGSPTKYRVSGKRIIFDVNPDYSSTAGIKIFFSRSPKPILTTDTVREAGIPRTFDMLLGLLACYQFASAKDIKVKNDLLNDILREERRLGVHIQKNNEHLSVVITPSEVNSI